MLSLHDTASGNRRVLSSRRQGEVSLYVCGPTVYDVPHLGHGRSALVYDVLRRYLSWRGVSVTLVSNVTDIDDKIINRARELGETPSEVARRYEDAWWSACGMLGVELPTYAPRATEYVEEMVELIARLVDTGHAYVAGEGVWFSSGSVPDYGLLAHQPVESLMAGARVEVDAAKRSPIDFALWKFSREGEPSWESPWGPGRPGWHTECVVMSLGLLGEGFDLHAGGMDLAFPHHENERAQAVALGKDFARHWMHHAFVEVGGEKMAKSLGNYVSLTDLLEREDPRALRLLVLRAHYRSPMEVTPSAVADASDALGRVDTLARRLANLGTSTDRPAEGQTSRVLQERFCRAMDDDLDTPRATALIFEAIRSANSALDRGDVRLGGDLGATALDLAGALGVFPVGEVVEIPEQLSMLLDQRAAARSAKDWSTADRIRDEIAALGWVVQDGPGGRQEVHRAN
jgi:cysteinyl-tRNA synthetase